MSKVLIIAALLLYLVVAIVGYTVGRRDGAAEQNLKDQLRRDYAPAAAEELLSRGEVKKALAELYVAKASERAEGLVDSELGKAYAADKRPCLAQSFLESSIEFMEKERLASAPAYERVKELLAEQRQECSKVSGKGLSRSLWNSPSSPDTSDVYEDGAAVARA